MYDILNTHPGTASTSMPSRDKAQTKRVREGPTLQGAPAPQRFPTQAQVHSAAAGHPFHDLLPTHEISLRCFALKLCANRHRAEDLVQETFLKAWAKRDQFNLGTDLRAWLFTILRNSFYSDLRKFKREVEDIDGKMAATLSHEPSQEHAVELTKLISAIATLPEIQRLPLVLIGIYGYSQHEAANACGCAVGTIKSRISRGRNSLNQSLGQGPPG